MNILLRHLKFSELLIKHQEATAYAHNTWRSLSRQSNPAGIYLLKINSRYTRAKCKMCSKLTVKIPERRHWRYSELWTCNCPLGSTSSELYFFKHNSGDCWILDPTTILGFYSEAAIESCSGKKLFWRF